ncbi:uncharacterized protein A4U43_UnF10030 [Asparagus officinalis]|uniref:Uncharacterized protein n=1 Tax=Asparagus officinalis TaxID=4686 RepID=A0A1R3L5K7_ASPOF|nr:uncharacterized protein A4U43_UnF10030 [Asparagus officinalis]
MDASKSRSTGAVENGWSSAAAAAAREFRPLDASDPTTSDLDHRSRVKRGPAGCYNGVRWRIRPRQHIVVGGDEEKEESGVWWGLVGRRPPAMRLRRLREAGRGELVEGLRLKAGRESDCRRRSVRGSSTSLGDNWSRVVEGSSSRGFAEKLVESLIGVDDLFEGL